MSILGRTEVKKYVEIPIENIKPSPFQPRKDFDYYELSRLSLSIRENGLLQPITVRKTEDGFFELISGERRLRASKMAGLRNIPAIVMQVNDRQSTVFALLENLQRSDLNFFEEAEGIERLVTDFGFSYTDVALSLGIARSTLSNKLRILKLDKEIRRRILAASLTEHHARALLRLDATHREEVLNTVIAKSLTAAQTEHLIEGLLSPKEECQKRTVICDTRIFSNSIDRMVKTFRAQGVRATTTKTEDEKSLKFTITISK